MSIPLAKLLQPVSGEQPCGPDLSYDPRYDELENLLKGKPGVEIGSVVKPAEPPDWRTLQEKAVEFLGAAKHLRPAVILACATLRVEGFSGIRDGLRLVRGLLENFWGDLHPNLDPDDNNDPQQRLNILSGLTSPRNPGSDVAGWLQIVDYLHQAPICSPRGMPPISLETLDLAQTPAVPAADGGTAAPVMDLASVEAQIRSTDPTQLFAHHGCVKDAIEDARGIDAFLSNTLGAGGSISFDELTSTLARLERVIGNYLPGAEVPADAAPAGEGADAPAAAQAGPAISGSVRSRDDVIRTLDKICEYYRQVEPGSPVPYLLRRAQKLALMNFVDAMLELSLASPDQLRPAMGSAIEVPGE